MSVRSNCILNDFLFSKFSVDPVTYLSRFQWDVARYPIRLSLKGIVEMVSKVAEKPSIMLYR